MHLTRENVAFIRALQSRILAAPEKYDQTHFCGTVVCLAGHGYLLLHPELTSIPSDSELVDPSSFDSFLSEMLIEVGDAMGLPNSSWINMLFSTGCSWPEPYRQSRFRPNPDGVIALLDDLIAGRNPFVSYAYLEDEEITVEREVAEPALEADLILA